MRSKKGVSTAAQTHWGFSAVAITISPLPIRLACAAARVRPTFVRMSQSYFLPGRRSRFTALLRIQLTARDVTHFQNLESNGDESFSHGLRREMQKMPGNIQRQGGVVEVFDLPTVIIGHIDHQSAAGAKQIKGPFEDGAGIGNVLERLPHRHHIEAAQRQIGMRKSALKRGNSGRLNRGDGVGADVDARDIPAHRGHSAEERSVAAAEIQKPALAAIGNAKSEAAPRV